MHTLLEAQLNLNNNVPWTEFTIKEAVTRALELHFSLQQIPLTLIRG
jgi:hypothetical protein